MADLQNLPLFVLSGLLLNMAPGPDSLLVVSRSAAHGWRAGSAAALGIGAGTFVHIAAGALGLSALLASSSAAFGLLKCLGAAYLLYVGLQMLFSRGSGAALDNSLSSAPQTSVVKHRSIFLQGFLTNVLNPKVALFFLAFVPQFIAPQASNKALAFVMLGCIFNVGGMLWCHGLALSAAFASQRIRINRSLVLWLNRAIGALFVSFALRLALADRV